MGLALLAIVLVPGIGHEANGAVRWIRVGPFNVQTSEFMKLFMVVYLAGYLVRRQEVVTHSIAAFLRPMLLLVFACALIMLQPDFGTTFVLLCTALGMMFLGGAALWQFGVLIVVASAALVGLVITSPYRLQRVVAFLDPWSDPLGSGYQLSQALIALGRGEWAGVGLGNGIQKQFYLPEAHTDFIMAVIGEEFGLVGIVAVVGLFAIIFWRAFANGALAEQVGNRFAAFVSYGCGLWVGLQACINVGVNVGRLPTKGLTMPLLSYGSNSVIVTCMAVGLLLRVHHEVREAGGARRGVRRWDRAIVEYQSILKADPHDVTVCNNLGDLFARAGKTAEAIDQYLKLGELYRADGLSVKAIAVYKKIAKLDPARTEAYLACADLYWEQGMVGEAKIQMATVVEHFSKSGETQKLVDAYKRLSQFDPTNAAVLARL